MYKYIVPGAAALALLVPFAASAHEHAMYQIGGSTYMITIGSLNEPVAVDDKTGVDLAVSKGMGPMTMGPDGDMDGPPANSAPVTGLENTLKVELVAGSRTKTLALMPAWNKPGSYTAPFYPTVATTIAYHLTGSIDQHPVDLTFTCVPDASAAAGDSTKKDLGGGVMQLSLGGGFGCPVAKETLGFPEQSVPAGVLAATAKSAQDSAHVALGLAAAALAAALAFGLARRKKS